MQIFYENSRSPESLHPKRLAPVPPSVRRECFLIGIFLFENVVPCMTHRIRFISEAQQLDGPCGALSGFRTSRTLCINTEREPVATVHVSTETRISSPSSWISSLVCPGEDQIMILSRQHLLSVPAMQQLELFSQLAYLAVPIASTPPTLPPGR